MATNFDGEITSVILILFESRCNFGNLYFIEEFNKIIFNFLIYLLYICTFCIEKCRKERYIILIIVIKYGLSSVFTNYINFYCNL